MKRYPEAHGRPGSEPYLVGATYAGLLGAGAELGQQDAASNAAAAAINAIFMVEKRVLVLETGVHRAPAWRRD